MPAKLLQFPDPRKPKPASEAVDLGAISISFGGETYTLQMAGTITHDSGGQQPAKPAKTGTPAAEKR